MGYNGWPVPPPPGWRPPHWREQISWIVGLIIAVTLIVDILIAVISIYRPWDKQMTWARQMLLCAAVPLNLTALGVGIWRLVRRKR